jgi:TRAP-type C4-dicarboxylate transport system permease small subunit
MAGYAARLDAVFDAYLNTTRVLFSAVATFMFAVMLAVNAWNILLRVVAAQGITWHQEVSILAAFWIYFGAYALIAKSDAYIRIEFLVDRLPQAAQRAIGLLVQVIVIAFHLIVLELCITMLRVVSIYETPILQWPEYLFYVPLAVGTADIVLTEIIRTVRILALRPHTAMDG